MKKFALALLTGIGLFITGNSVSEAQDLTLGSIYEKENVPYRRPVPLPYLREADVVWSKMLWRMVDLREKSNHHLYFPEQPFGPRMSLIDVLYSAVSNGELKVYISEEFNVPIDMETIDRRLGGDTTLETVVDVVTGDEITVEILGEVRTYEVREYLVLEQWYFDRQHSTFGSRVIGFSPIRVYYVEEELRRETVFWVYFPDAREIMARHEVFTANNDLSSLSFDDVFLQRRFSGYIYRESNVYGNRFISDYALGRDALYEAERIHNMIFNFEQDLWEY